MTRASLRVLIVEDQFLIAKQIELVLGGCGHTIVGVAADMAGALTLASSLKPDLTLVDVSLADGVTGPAIARHIAEKDQGAVLFTTANVRRLPTDFCGAIGSIEKPFTQAGLVAAIDYIESQIINAERNSKAASTSKPSSLKLSPRFDTLFNSASPPSSNASMGQSA